MEIENWRDGPHMSNVVGIFDIYFGPKSTMRFKNFKIVRSKKGNTFVAFPSFAVDLPDGKKKWIPYLEFSPEKQEEFSKKLDELIKPYLDKTPEPIYNQDSNEVPF